MINIQDKTSKLLKELLELPEETTIELFNLGILQDHTCRKVLIVEEYKEKCFTMLKTDLKLSLADKYHVSYSSVEKYVKNL